MFWLLVFLAVAGTLAYRATPLPTATGVLGVTLLLYGWLGDSAGYFLLLLLAYLALFVPLNAVALRQEWFSRPLLERWLARPDTAPSPLDAPGSAAPLLEGAPPPSQPPSVVTGTPDAELRAEALAAALAARLHTPLLPAEPLPAQARVAELLYAAAALAAQAPRLLAHEQPDSGLLARAALAWPLARQTAALRGLAPEASLAWAAPAPETALARRLETAHRPGRALIEAARLDAPASRLIAFDEALWPLLGRLLGGLVRCGVKSFLVRLPVAPEDADRRRQQRSALASERLAVLVSLRLLLDRLGTLPAGFETALAQATLSQLTAQAALAWHAASRQPAGERPLLESLLGGQLQQFDTALLAALRELPQPWLRMTLRVLLMPLPASRPPTQAETRAAAETFLREPALRARLADGLPSPDALQALDARVETQRRLEPTLRRLRLARFDPPPTDDANLLTSATRLGLLSDEESATLSEALDFAANELRSETQ